MTRLSSLSLSGWMALKLLCGGVFLLLVLPAFAQQGGTHPTQPTQTPSAAPPPKPSTSPDFPPASSPFDQNDLLYRSSNKPLFSNILKGGNCFLPPLNGLPPATVSVKDLQIPAKAQKAHEDGCAALRNNKITEAESHFRKAVRQWPEYLAAWVVLGQILEAQQKSEDAHDTCSKPLATDPNYLPAYLCLADISAHSEQWDSVLQVSTRALEIDPTNDALAYDYNAAANFHLHRLPEAERSALRAAGIDKSNADPRVHFLLAQIYEAKGDRTGEVAQLREYLKFATNPNDVAMINRYLSRLEKPTQ